MNPQLGLKDFEKKITVRTLREADYEEVVALQLSCFPGMKPWAKEQFQSQLSIFPDGLTRAMSMG